jgi:hypothetical protein
LYTTYGNLCPDHEARRREGGIHITITEQEGKEEEGRGECGELGSQSSTGNMKLTPVLEAEPGRQQKHEKKPYRKAC